ncbi:hypothetical protein SKAU_G00325680 [Synaphobranchus kaupii]|uniref:Mesenteric estrogen-dependent adipogenesis protein n=1 Tax=Synaphobranchus kaupii TaxID=118154 RepID=A0A9Q1EPN9_SYNKA|nr:hypothetical protein SKAU_G00325680 [Synaphobranchus kaupii]
MEADSKFLMDVTELEDFLRNPPVDFTVDVRGTGYRFVKYDCDRCCVFINEIQTTKGKVIFQNSPGRAIKVHTPKDYMQVRKNITSKRIYILVSACEGAAKSKKRKDAKALGELRQYIVAIDGSNPVIKWEIEKGLDWTISSVAGESYRVDIDLGDIVNSWMGETFQIPVDGQKVKPVWKNTYFTLKYYSDALFDFSHWLGGSRRQIKIHGR